MKILTSIVFCLLSICLTAQTYEEITISDEVREQSRNYQNGFAIYGGYHMPLGGVKRGFSNGWGVGFDYIHSLERAWLRASFSYAQYKGKSNVADFSIGYDFQNLHLIEYKFGVFWKIDLADNFTMGPGIESGSGVAWHKRELSNPNINNPIYLNNRAISILYPINFNLRIEYMISKNIGIFVQPEAGVLFTFLLYSGVYDDSAYYLFESKDDLLSYVFNVNAGITFLMDRGKQKK